MNAMKKLLVLDLDGTLLTENKNITNNTQHYLKQAMDKGTEICIATGRIFDSAKLFPLTYNLKAHMICANGAMIKDPYSLQEYYRAVLDVKEAQEIANYAMEIDALIHLFTSTEWYISKVEESALKYGRANNITPKMIGDIQSWEDLDIIKLVLVDTPEKIDMLEKWAGERKFNINAVRSDPHSIDITHKSATKGNGVRLLAESLGIEKSNIIAVGNYYNDVDMFNEANIGVAMGNSPEEVKQAADYVTKTNEEDGVAWVIYKYILDNY